MADIKIRRDHYLSTIVQRGNSYFPSGDLLNGRDGFFIKEDYYRSSKFCSDLVTVLFKYYPKQLADFMRVNRGVNLDDINQINQLFDKIRDLNLIKYLAKETDGFVNQVACSSREWNEISRHDSDFFKPVKKTNIIFLNIN